MDNETEARLGDVDMRLESIQKSQHQLLYFMAWFTLGIIATISMYAFIPPYGALVGVVWIVNTCGIVLKLQKFMTR
jgi:hypothetical protein